MADKSASFYQVSTASIAKKAFTDLVTFLQPLLVFPSGLLMAIKINFFDQLTKPAAPSSVSSKRILVITGVVVLSSDTSQSASNGDDQNLSEITIIPSSSSSSSPPPTSTEKTLGCVDPAVGENRITFMLVPNPNPASSNQMLSAFQKSDLSKVILAVVAPVTGGMLVLMFNSPQLYSTLPHWLMPFVICTLSFGSTFVIQGILFRERFPRFSAALEELGFVILLLGFCSLVTSIIPKNVVWAPWSCYVLTLLALVVLRFHEAASAGSSTTSAR